MRRRATFPIVRSARLTGDWRIREEIDAIDPEEANQAAQSAVAAGAEEIAFLNAVVNNASDLGMLLVGLQTIPVHFQTADEPLLRLLIERSKGRKDPQSSIDRMEPAHQSGLCCGGPSHRAASACSLHSSMARNSKRPARPRSKRLVSHWRPGSIFLRRCNRAASTSIAPQPQSRSPSRLARATSSRLPSSAPSACCGPGLSRALAEPLKVQRLASMRALRAGTRPSTIRT